MTAPDDKAGVQPLFVIDSPATDEAIAALVVLIAARPAPSPPTPRPRPAWSRTDRVLRRPLPATWRDSVRPH